MSESAPDAATNKDKNTTGSAPASGTPNTAEDAAERIRRRNMFRDSIDQIDVSVNAGAENGLFEEIKDDKTPNDIFTRILGKLDEAKTSLKNDEYLYKEKPRESYLKRLSFTQKHCTNANGIGVMSICMEFMCGFI